MISSYHIISYPCSATHSNAFIGPEAVLSDVPQHFEEDSWRSKKPLAAEVDGSCVRVPALHRLLADRVEFAHPWVVERIRYTAGVRHALTAPLVHVIMQNHLAQGSTDLDLLSTLLAPAATRW